MLRLSRQLFFRPLARYQHLPPKVSNPANRFQKTFRRLTMAFVFSCGTVYSIKYYLQKDEDDNDEKGQRLQGVWPFRLLAKTPKKMCEVCQDNKNDISWKVFSDPVHGHITLHPVCAAIVDTPEFQRLRNIKQLGGGYFVYPGASHNRFEHSIGVCHLAGKLVRSLRERQPELGITREDILCVEIAGLCHDLGHGPFSHVFDNMVIPKVMEEEQDSAGDPGAEPLAEKECGLKEKDKKKAVALKHEDLSLKMFDHMIAKNPHVKHALEQYRIDGEKELNFIKNMINPPPSDEKKIDDGRGADKTFLYQIVANKQSEVDVDKWDYIARDCLQLGMRSSFDHNRFIRFARAIEHKGKRKLCVRDKEAFNVYQLFQTRHALHKKAYLHRGKVIVEYMLAEILIKAKDAKIIPGENTQQKKSIKECLRTLDMYAYTNLTDEVLHLIRASEDTDLQDSRELLQAFDTRNLYSFVVQSKPTEKELTEEVQEKIKTDLLEKSNFADDRIVELKAKLDFGKKTKNPVREQLFYSKDAPDKAITISQTEVSYMLPNETFQEQWIRFFLKQKHKEARKPKDQDTEAIKEHKEDCKRLKVCFEDIVRSKKYSELSDK